MRRLLLSMLMMAVIDGHSQDTTAQAKVEGLGPFKIGETTIPAFINIVNNEGYKILTLKQLLNPFAFRMNVDNVIQEVMYNPKAATFTPQDANVEGTRTFMIYKYKIAGIILPQFQLMFKDDILIYMSCPATTELEELLVLKYGDKGKTTEEKEVTCEYKSTGHEEIQKDNSYTFSWKNKFIEASIMSIMYHDAQCKQQIIYKFKVQDKEMMDVIGIKEAENKGQLDEIKKKQQLEDIKSL